MPPCKNAPAVLFRRIDFKNKVIFAACQECWEKYYLKAGPLKVIYEEVSQEEFVILEVTES